MSLRRGAAPSRPWLPFANALATWTVERLREWRDDRKVRPQLGALRATYTPARAFGARELRARMKALVRGYAKSVLR